MVVLGLVAAEEEEEEVLPSFCGVDVFERGRLCAVRREACRRNAERARVRENADSAPPPPPLKEESDAFLGGDWSEVSADLLACLASERRRRSERAEARQRRLRSAIGDLSRRAESAWHLDRIAAASDEDLDAAIEAARGLPELSAAIDSALARRKGRERERRERRERLDAAAAAEAQQQRQREQQQRQDEEEQQRRQREQQEQQQKEREERRREKEHDDASSEARSEARAASAAARSLASALESQRELKLGACRALKKVVGAAVNSVQNDRSSVRRATQTITRALTDPFGGDSRPFGGGQPPILRHQHGLPEDLFPYAAHLLCERVLERLLDDTFDRKRDAWGLAALVAALTSKVPRLRRVFQGYLADASPAAVATPDDAEHAERVASFTAALVCLGDNDAAFGGLAAAWTWLARYANNVSRHRDPLAVLPALVAFLDNSAFALASAFHVHFHALLATLLAWFQRRAASFHGAAAVKLKDFLDLASSSPPRGGAGGTAAVVCVPPPGLQAYLASSSS